MAVNTYHLPLDEAAAVAYITDRVQDRREHTPTSAHIETLEATHVVPPAAEEAVQVYNLIVNPEPQRVFPQHAVDMVRLNRAYMTALTRAYIDRQLGRIWTEGGRPWLITV